MDVSKAIRTKRAVRKYSDEPVPDDVINQILSIARWSQSSKNGQPWDFFVVTDKDLLAELSKSGDFATHLPSAAFGIALVGDSDHYLVGFDLGQAAMCLQLAAWEVGVGSCLISFHRSEQAAEILGVPEGKYVRVGIAFGYPSSEHRPAKMGRRDALDDITHWNKW
jgi:nitroreductase